MIGALLWARDVKRRARGLGASYRGPWIMGISGAVVFVFYLWLVSHGA